MSEPVVPDTNVPMLMDTRTTALFIAAVYCGLTCLSQGSVPSRPAFVIATAKQFEVFLTSDEVDDTVT